jgi:hypothetical protein
MHLAPSPKFAQKPLKEEKKPAEVTAQKPLMRLTPDMLKQGSKPVKAEDLMNKALNAEVAPPPIDVEGMMTARGRVGLDRLPGVTVVMPIVRRVRRSAKIVR